MSKGHEHMDQRLTELLTGDLNDTEQSEVRAHLDSCPLCRQRLKSLQRTMTALERSRSLEAPAGYFGTILPRLRQRIGRPHSWSSVPILRWPHLAAPIAAAILITGLLTSIPSPNQGPGDLAAITRGLEAGDLLEAYIDELQTTPLTGMSPEDVAGGAASGVVLSKNLLEVMLDEEVMQELGSVDELDQKDVETILRRLETRKLL